MKRFKVFILTQDTSPEARDKHPSERERMFSFDVEAETGEDAVARARALFDRDHAAPHLHVEGVSVLDM